VGDFSATALSLGATLKEISVVRNWFLLEVSEVGTSTDSFFGIGSAPTLL
jgi:hypothetical protein